MEAADLRLPGLATTVSELNDDPLPITSIDTPEDSLPIAADHTHIHRLDDPDLTPEDPLPTNSTPEDPDSTPEDSIRADSTLEDPLPSDSHLTITIPDPQAAPSTSHFPVTTAECAPKLALETDLTSQVDSNNDGSYTSVHPSSLAHFPLKGENIAFTNISTGHGVECVLEPVL